jgi:Xaa-Pro aminopeptidase
MTAPRKTTPLVLCGATADESDVRHLTGFSAPDPFLCILDRGWSHLVVSSLELGRAQALPGRIVCHTPEELNAETAARGLAAQVIGYAELKGHDKIRVSSRFPVGVVRDVEAHGIEVDVNPDPQRPGRLIKTEDEVAALKQAQRAAVAGVRAGMGLIQQSTVRANGDLEAPNGKRLTSEAVRAEIGQVLLRYGCAPDEIIVAGGDQAVDPHERGSGPLQAGQWIILDVFPRSSSGYWGDITRSVMKGRPSPEQRSLYQTVQRAQGKALSALKAGVTGDEIHQGIVAAFEAAGFTTGKKNGVPQGFIHSTGHGVGLEIHEAPRISPGAGKLRAGMVVTVEPGLYYRGLGGVRIEDTVVVREDGCEFLARCTKKGVL